MSNLFPRTTVAGVSLSRMIIGTNWILGWSHRSPAADQYIKNRFPDGEAVLPLLRVLLPALQPLPLRAQLLLQLPALLPLLQRALPLLLPQACCQMLIPMIRRSLPA